VYNALFLTDRAQAGIAKQQLDGEREALALLRARWERLQVRAGSDGTFVAPRANDMPGRYYREGDPLGYVIDLARPIVRVVVAQESVDQVRQGTDRVSVRFAHRPEAVAVGRIVRLVPAGDEYLPSRALSVEGGGRIATDPRDQKGARTMERMFQLDVEFEDKDTAQRAFFGERLYVRFDHAAEPMGVQWYRAVRLLFLSHFHV
jgi:putative peptide zinc metalloprotease protein